MATTPIGSISGIINVRGDQDWIKLTLEANTLYGFTLTGITFNGISAASLFLYDSTTTSIEYGLSYGGGAAAFMLPTSGTYYLGVGGPMSFDVTGNYTLSLVSSPDDFRNNISTSGAIANPGTASGTINLSGDHDWYKVSLTGDTLYAVTTTGLATNGTSTLSLGVFDATGKAAGTLDATGSAALGFMPGTSGNYYIDASSLTVGDYSVSIAVATDDFRNNPTTIGALTLGAPTAANINVAGDHDWFKVNLAANTLYKISTTADAGSIAVFDANGLPVDDMIGSISGTDAFMTATSGVYYVDVGSSKAGAYTVTATVNPDDFFNNVSTSGRVSVGTPVNGVINLAGDHDWFKVDLQANVLYGIATPGETLFPGFNLPSTNFTQIRDGNGVALTSLDAYGIAGGTGFMPTTTGSYYIDVSSFYIATGLSSAYTLNVDRSADDFTNNTSTNGIVRVGETVGGFLNVVGDHDWFKMELTANTLYAISTTGLVTGDQATSYLYVYDDAGLNLPAVDAIGIGAIGFMPATSGTYYLDVAGTGVTTAGSYTVKLLTSPDDFPSNRTTTASLGAEPPDTTPPAVSAFSPLDGASSVAGGADVQITFNEAIQKGTGTVVIKTAAGATFASYDVSTSTNLSISGSTLTINPSSSLSPSTQYFVELATGVVKDLAGNAAPGIATYDFTTSAPVNTPATGTVTISGSAVQGQTLTAGNALFDPDGVNTINYQWKANGTAIAGATTNTLVLTEALVGKSITVTAAFTDDIGYAESVTSLASAAVSNVNDAPTGAVTISGSPILGQTMTASNSLADADGIPASGVGAISYQWKASDVNIAGATGSTLVLTQSQVGKSISVTASYVDGHGTSESVSSSTTASVSAANAAPTGSVTITGTVTQGQTLTATNTVADSDVLGSISYQWKANGVAIAGATSSTLTLTESEVGKSITVSANYTDGHGTAESVSSNATSAVSNINDAPTGTVTITGNTSVGQLLTAANTLADPDGLGTISYQWNAGGVAISGATGSTLTLSEAQVGKAITVTARYTDGHGTAEAMSSVATASVASAPPQPVNGTTGNDRLPSTAGNDAIDGKAGIDTAVYTARMAAYTPSPTAVSGPDGSDTLANIERLQFLDANLAFDIDANAGQVYRLYQAAFNRTPDLSGLGGWIAAMDDGMPLLTIASKFMESAEFQSLYGANPTNAQFVANLYTNALHRPSQQDAGSAAGWVNQLSTNAVSKAQALVNFSESAENKASVLPVISGGITYANASQAAGAAKGQSFAGTPNTDSLIGTVGNDTFTGGSGNDTIEGGKGLDTAVYSGAKASHTIARTTTGLTVASGSAGTDTLTNVERLKFDDAILAMDTAGNAGQTYRLYQAAFNRTPDKAGLSDWVKGMDTGLTLTQMATAFIGSGEFKSKYGESPTNAQFVDLLYTNALHRARAVGDDYWTNQLDSGVTREQALIGFSESAENQASLIGVIQNGMALTG
jgi:hypothetical protein